MSVVAEKEPAHAKLPKLPLKPNAWRRSWFAHRLRLLLLIGVVCGLAALSAPMLLWAYDLERAGALIDTGLAWPAPRQAGSLPVLSDRAALQRALPYLDAAIQRRPTHSQAYRLSGQVYAALAEWGRAAAAYERAIALSPGNPLLRWEASLIYRRMQQLVDHSPRTPLTEVFAAGDLAAPGELIKSLYCSAQGAASCYFGRALYRQPFARYPDGPALKLPVLFLHPPAGLTQQIAIPADQAGLHFVIGLDPVARGWATDGAVFRVWVQPPGQQRQLVAELPLDRATALSGWAPGAADLTPWAGQTVLLTLESGAGPLGDQADDWYGWGDLSLMPAELARYAAALPEQRAAELRRGIQ